MERRFPFEPRSWHREKRVARARESMRSVDPKFGCDLRSRIEFVNGRPGGAARSSSALPVRASVR